MNFWEMMRAMLWTTMTLEEAEMNAEMSRDFELPTTFRAMFM